MYYNYVHNYAHVHVQYTYNNYNVTTVELVYCEHHWGYTQSVLMKRCTQYKGMYMYIERRFTLECGTQASGTCTTSERLTVHVCVHVPNLTE